MSFAEKLQQLRSAAGLTQEALARAAGLSLAVIRDYEQGKKEPTLRSAFKLASVLSVSLDVFRDVAATGPEPRPHGRPKKADQTPTAETKKGTRKKGG